MIVKIKEIEIATKTIPLIFVPIQMIKIGAKAVFGKAFNTTKKGSIIFATILNSNKIIAITIPNIVPIIKPKITSYDDTHV